MNKILFFLSIVFLSGCNGAGQSSVVGKNGVVNIDSRNLPDPDMLDITHYNDSDYISEFVFSASTNINTSDKDPKITNLTVVFYSDNNCQNQVGHSVNVDTSNENRLQWAANTKHTFRGWNIMFCGNFNGVPNNQQDVDTACLNELYQTYSIKYTFTYSVRDLSGEYLTNSYCKVGKISDTSSQPAPCTYSRKETCGYGGGLGGYTPYITIPLGHAAWWLSCKNPNYHIEDGGKYWRLDASCNNSSGQPQMTSICYGDVSSLDNICPSDYATPGYSNICQNSLSSTGSSVVNWNGALICAPE